MRAKASPREPQTAPPAETFFIQDYRQVYEGVALPVLIIDHASWRILAVNEAALTQYGYTREEFVGLSALEVRPPEGRADARRVMSEMPHGFWKTTSAQHCRKDGSVFSVDVWSRDTVVGGRPVRVATINEVTERARIQRELQQAQKMEVVGRLAGGVAHDFNNALTAILGGADLLLDRFWDDPEARSDLQDIQHAARRASVITGQLLAFSRQQVMSVELCSLSQVVERSMGLLKQVLTEDIDLQIHIDCESWPVQVDAVQIEHVLMNLVMNARDAMPRGGTLVLATENVSVSPEEVRNDAAVPPGDYAGLTVRDTGIGMDEITSARVFEPFFTTKPPPEGTGLGLSTAYGIIRQSGGFITVDSTPGEGTTFRILLPRADGAPAEAPTIHQIVEPASRTALVVDDDEAVRRSTGRVLRDLGCAVFTAASAEEALARLAGSPGIPDLLVTALSLPGMDGRDLADHLQSAQPDLGVLFLSGYAFKGDDPPRDVGGGRALLQKPFSVEELSEATRRLLAAL